MISPILKFTAPLIHDGRHFLKDKVLVTDGAGKVLDMVSRAEAGENVKCLDGILCPGFVNAHCHLELSHMKGVIAEHTGLVNFLIAVLQRRNHIDEKTIREAAIAAETQMLAQGIVAVGDIANTTDSLEIKRRRKLHYHTFLEVMGFSAPDAAGRLQAAQERADAFRQNGLPVSVVPHAPYSVSGELFHLINRINASGPVSIHNQECAAENQLYEGKTSDFYRLYNTLHLDTAGFKATGQSSLQSWLPHFSREQKLLPVHNTFTSEEDMEFARQYPGYIYWCLCPNANAYIENRMPPVDLLRKHGCKITLGTDSLASNHQLSILEEIRTLTVRLPHLALEEMLQWATSSGAEALECDDRFGCFEKGKSPGLVHLFPLAEQDGQPAVMQETSVQRVTLS